MAEADSLDIPEGYIITKYHRAKVAAMHGLSDETFATERCSRCYHEVRADENYRSRGSANCIVEMLSNMSRDTVNDFISDSFLILLFW